MSLTRYTTPCLVCREEVIFPYKCDQCNGLYCFEHRAHETHRLLSKTMQNETIMVPRLSREPVTMVYSNRLNNAKGRTGRQSILQPPKIETSKVPLCPWCGHSMAQLRVKKGGRFSTITTCPNRYAHKDVSYNRIRKSIIHTRDELISINQETDSQLKLIKLARADGCPRCGHLHAYVCQQRRVVGDDRTVMILRCAKCDYSFEG